ncbi:MAG TPA: hypothetical protein VM074_06800 [Solimonas sp.]|nr:hypothetical protein [Solimonas sp.]
MRTAAIAVASLALAACNGSSTSSISLPGDPAPAAPLCVSSSCGTKTVLLDIPSAENLFFTDTGRLFVSGSENVYEITRDGAGAFQATPIFDGTGNFGGIAQIGDVLYVNGFDTGGLYAARLTATPQLAEIHALGLGSPNGLTAGPDGELYIVNGPIPSGSLPDPKIVKVRLDPADPLKVLDQADWLVGAPLTFPNGIQRRARTLYFAESDTTSVTFGSIRTVEVLPDGSAGEPQTLGTFDSIADDLGLAGDQVLIAYYSSNQLALMGANGSILQTTDPLSFDNPSSVRLGRPPLFAANQLVVTEKGVVGLPPTPGYGNVLSVFTPNPP